MGTNFYMVQPFFLSCFAGWMNRHQQVVIEYLEEEIWVLKEQLGHLWGRKPHNP